MINNAAVFDQRQRAAAYTASDAADWYTPTRAYYHAKLAQIMLAITLAERNQGRLDVACIRVPAVRLDPGRLAEQSAVLRALYAPKNAAAATPERIADSYARIATREVSSTPPDQVYLDERLRVVRCPPFGLG